MVPSFKWSHLPIMVLTGLLIGGVFSYAVVLISQKTPARMDAQPTPPRPTLTPR